ncbi:MAG: DUF433 domain-containing protein [candidate division Zixibacteria bacterium]|jgi:uncharacterized protein (DUF433 family)|nr:DUF433 domain-containing protein [candidate division Zixibacteria bacterium]
MQKSIVIRDTGVSVTDILRGIGKGYTYEQILRYLPALNQTDIMAAAMFAHDLIMAQVSTEHEIQIEAEIKLIANKGQVIDLTKLREKFPRAYENWESGEDNQLVSMHRQGLSINEISVQLKRQPGAIVSRLKSLGAFSRGDASRQDHRPSGGSSKGS